jgi:hypothetical protein
MGYNLGERVIRKHLLGVQPAYARERRQGTERQINPSPYYAEYAGQKLHMDQNEKVVMFGVTHVCAMDGYIGKLVGFSTMPQKNNVVIYDDVYRKTDLEYGLFDQLRVDHGHLWYRGHSTNIWKPDTKIKPSDVSCEVIMCYI